MDKLNQALPQTYNPVKVSSGSPKKYLKITAAAATVIVDEVDATGVVLAANLVPSTAWADGDKIAFSFDNQRFVIGRFGVDTNPTPEGVSAVADLPVT